MRRNRRKRIERHLSEGELDEKVRNTNDPELVRRLCFVKNLYRGDTLAEAAARVGKSQPTGVRWADRWNEGGLDGLAPSYGGGRPPKLGADEREQLIATLEDDHSRSTREIRQFIQDEFGVTYHPNYVHELVRSFDG